MVGDIGRAFNDAIRKEVRADWGQITNPDQRRNIVRQLLRQVPCLLIWDNVEPVAGFPAGTPSDWSAEEQEELRAFLVALRAGKTHVLLTSRRDEKGWLGDVFRKVELRGLPKAEAEELAEKILERAGVNLAGLENYTDLLAYLKGNPLALQAILPELKTRKPADLLRDLQSGEANLSADDPALGRQRSLAASLGYRLDKLDPVLRQRLVVLALFQGFVNVGVLNLMGMTDGAPEAIRGQTKEQWDAVLGRAAEVGLFRRVGEEWYTVHPAVPWFLSDLLEEALPGLRPNLEAAYCSVYARYVEFLFNLMNTNANLATTLFRAEIGNLQHALALAERGQDWSCANNILLGLDPLMRLDSRWAEWNRTLTRFERLTTDATGGPVASHEHLWRTVLGLRAQYASERHDLALAAILFERLLGEYRRRGEKQNEAAILHSLGVVARDRGDLGEAERWCRESLAIKEKLGDDRGRAIALHLLGWIAEERGDLGEAEQRYRESLRIEERLGDHRRRAQTLHQLGNVTYRRFLMLNDPKDLDEAEGCYRKSLEIDEQLKNDHGRAFALYQLGMLASNRGNLNAEERWYRESLEIFERLDDDRGRASAFHQLGMVDENRGDTDEAERWYRESLGIKERIGDNHGRAFTLGRLGLLAEKRGRVAEALGFFRQAEQIFERIGDAPNLARTRENLKRAQPS